MTDDTQRNETEPGVETVLLRPRDLLLFGYIPFMTLIAWAVPERLWPAVIRTIVRLSVSMKTAWIEKAGALLADMLGADWVPDPHSLIEPQRVEANIARLEFLRCHRPGGWQPRIRVDGSEQIDLALELGRGAVLWVMPMMHSYLVTKMALSRAGYAVNHLSRIEHGSYATSRLGARLFNWIETVIEARNVAERLVISEDQMSGSLRALAKRLRGNGIISVTVAARGRRWYDVPFLRGRLRIAAGAPALALRTGAPLLPVFTVRTLDGGFVTIIEPSIEPALNLTGAAAEQDLAARFAERAGFHARRHPTQIDFARLHLIPPSLDHPEEAPSEVPSRSDKAA